MTVMLYLIGLSLVLGACGLAAFLWALSRGQFDDLDGAANRILFDDDRIDAGRASEPSARPAGSRQGA